ncbi:MAG: SDR family oxidoreductase [Rhodospirillaceae bacterium]|jgi:glucose 1-dehydrogenase|nr:SDR family oxidoreductase [Rhodospirillaceae bacterium]
MRFKNRSVIVTGGASGIGRAICLTLAGEGAAVTVFDRTEEVREGGRPTVAEIAEAGGQADFVQGDVTSWDDLDRAVSGVAARHGRLDVMINNAAISVGKPLLETSEAEWEQVLAVNAKGVFLGCKRAVQQMIDQEVRAEARGRIVNISSQHGMISSPGDIAYGTGKAAVVYMTRQIAADYGPQQIICNAVAPGKIITGKPVRANEAELIDYSERRTPLPRLGRPDDVASAVAFLASDEARYITGENLMVDGGWMAA